MLTAVPFNSSPVPYPLSGLIKRDDVGEAFAFMFNAPAALIYSPTLEVAAVIVKPTVAKIVPPLSSMLTCLAAIDTGE